MSFSLRKQLLTNVTEDTLQIDDSCGCKIEVLSELDVRTGQIMLKCRTSQSPRDTQPSQSCYEQTETTPKVGLKQGPARHQSLISKIIDITESGVC